VKFSGSVPIAASRDAVWAFVSDPTKVGACGPGVESIERLDETHYRAIARVGVGFISARFTGTIAMVELAEPDRAVIRANGQAPGSAADATATMTLRDGDDAGSTVMDWEADVAIAGTLASVGARLIEGTANKLIGQTFDCIRAKLEG
jgi:carbon monoxide dehydrogenase subunit G